MQKLITLLAAMIISVAAYAQTPETYKLEFLDATWIPEEDNTVLAMFRVIPFKKNFKRVLSMRLTYRMDRGEETVVDIMNQEEVKTKLVIYGPNIQERNPTAYNLVKEEIAQDTANKEIMYLAFFFPKLETKPDSMRITYGLWEGKRSNKRIEQTFDFVLRHEAQPR